MLKFYVIIDFIDYQFLLIINTIRSVNLHRFVVIFYAFYFQSRFPKHGFFMHQVMMKTAIKLHFLPCLLYAPLLWQTSTKMIAEAYPRFFWFILL